MNENFLNQQNVGTPIIPTPNEALRLLHLIQVHQAAIVQQMQTETGSVPLIFLYTPGQCALLMYLEIIANEGLTKREKMAAICDFRVEDFLLAQIELHNMMEVQ